MAIEISHEALVALELSSTWVESNIQEKTGLSAEEIYGPDGKLNWLWSLRWDDAEAMRVEMCNNMGGGVPIEVIDELVCICLEESVRT